MAKPNTKNIVIISLVVLVAAMGLLLLMGPGKSSVPLSAKTDVAPLPNNFQSFPYAEEVLKKQLANDPNNPRFLSQLADLYFENRMFEQAISEYKKIVALAPKNVDSYNNRGLYADSYNDLGLSYSYIGKYNLAIESLKKGVAIDPGYQRIFLSLGFVHASNGATEPAVEALNKAIAINSGNTLGLEAKRILELVTSTPPLELR